MHKIYSDKFQTVNKKNKMCIINDFKKFEQEQVKYETID